jgi:hypothetical protein
VWRRRSGEILQAPHLSKVSFGYKPDGMGDEEWPTAVFLSLLALYSFSVYWRYINQREEFTQNDYMAHR